ncbi:MAG: hypothetical protein IPF92_30710 [Myxococcales bacterium]|nr:hypothetical protein [Myxococcales bacterium]
MAAALYASHSRELALAEVPEPLGAALRLHAERASLSVEAMRAWLTHRENPVASGFFGSLLGRRSNPADPDAEHDMVLALHATHLLVGTHGASRGTAVMSLPLLQATVTRGGVLAGHPLAAGLDVPADDGLTISGFPGTEGRPGTYFVGLGPGAADACFEAVRAAVARAKNAPP